MRGGLGMWQEMRDRKVESLLSHSALEQNAVVTFEFRVSQFRGTYKVPSLPWIWTSTVPKRVPEPSGLIATRC